MLEVPVACRAGERVPRKVGLASSGVKILHKLIEKALREHREEHGDVTGFLLITFRDGEALLTAQASECDEVAQKVIEGIEAALSEPISPADDEEDEIGVCAGQA